MNPRLATAETVTDPRRPPISDPHDVVMSLLGVLSENRVTIHSFARNVSADGVVSIDLSFTPEAS